MSHDGPRPAQSPHHVGQASGPWSRARVTIFLTTQYLDEADHLADEIAVLDHGRIVAEGTPGELKRRIPGGHVRLQFNRAARPRGGGQPPRRCPPRLRTKLLLQVSSDGSWRSLRRCRGSSTTPASRSRSCRSNTPDLDDVFFAVSGHPTTETASLHMSAVTYTLRDSSTMLAPRLRGCCATPR